MKTIKYFFLAAVLFIWAVTGYASGFKPYPAAQLDEPATKAAQQELISAGMKNTQARIYTTGDTFEKVVEFYKGIAKEYQMPGGTGAITLPSGQLLKESFFICDDRIRD